MHGVLQKTQTRVFTLTNYFVFERGQTFTRVPETQTIQFHWTELLHDVMVACRRGNEDGGLDGYFGRCWLATYHWSGARKNTDQRTAIKSIWARCLAVGEKVDEGLWVSLKGAH